MRRGKVLGWADCSVQGRTETARHVSASIRPTGGTLEIEGDQVADRHPAEGDDERPWFLSGDRKTEGIVADLSIRENIILACRPNAGIFRFLSKKRQSAIADDYIKQLGIKVSDAESPISQLSGGNQQKAMLARWIATEPKMLILDEPTRGIDVAAKLEIMGSRQEQCRKGLAILFISSKCRKSCVSDTIAVLRDRQKIGEKSGDDADEQKVFRMIAGWNHEYSRYYQEPAVLAARCAVPAGHGEFLVQSGLLRSVLLRAVCTAASSTSSTVRHR